MVVDNSVYDTPRDIWWSPDQPLASIRTSLNPARLEYLNQVIVANGLSTQGLRVLDVGCGGGLFAEELARLGCAVIGVDPSVGSLATARAHARAGGLSIDYRLGSGESLPCDAGSVDLVTCVDVFEHVTDLDRVIAEIARVLRPCGILLFDTINRTRQSELVMIRLAQQFPLTRWMPKDLHVAEKFIAPADLTTILDRAGLALRGETGMKPIAGPLQLLRLMSAVHRGRLTPEEFGRRSRMALSPDTSILYIGHAQKIGDDPGGSQAPSGRPGTMAADTPEGRLVVREARPDEFEVIGALAANAYRALGGEPESYIEEIRQTARRASEATVLVAVDLVGGILGTVSYVGAPEVPATEHQRVDEAGMRVLAVAPEARGKGVGRELVEAVIDRARTERLQGIGLFTRPSMQAAHRLYESLGFVRDTAADWQFAPHEWLWAYRLRF